MPEEIIGSSSEGSKGGFQAILEVEGVLGKVVRVPSKFKTGYGDKPPSDQAEIKLADAVILKMEPGEAEPDLKEGTFTTWMSYAQPGKPKPHVSTWFVKKFMKSGEALDSKRRGVDPKDGVFGNLYGTRILLKRVKEVLFQRPIEGEGAGIGADGKPLKEDVIKTDFVIVECAEADEGDIIEKVKAQVIGFTKATSKRNLVVSGLSNRFPQYLDALKNDTLADMLGLELVDEKFQAKKAVA